MYTLLEIAKSPFSKFPSPRSLLQVKISLSNWVRSQQILWGGGTSQKFLYLGRSSYRECPLVPYTSCLILHEEELINIIHSNPWNVKWLNSPAYLGNIRISKKKLKDNKLSRRQLAWKTLSLFQGFTFDTVQKRQAKNGREVQRGKDKECLNEGGPLTWPWTSAFQSSV